MPFVTIKTTSTSAVDVKSLKEKVAEKLSKPMNGLHYFVHRLDAQDVFVPGENYCVIVELCIGDRHGEDMAKEVVKTVVDTYKEMYSPDSILGYIQPTQSGMIYTGEKFV